MAVTETPDVVEWRASPTWALGWALLLALVVAPILGLMGWMAFGEIGNAPEGTWPAYIFFLYAFVGVILGTLIFVTLRGAFACSSLLFDARPVLRADRMRVEVRLPWRPFRSVTWNEIEAIEIESKRETPRRTILVNHIIFRLRDASASELSIQPQMAGLTLEAGHEMLERVRARFR